MRERGQNAKLTGGDFSTDEVGKFHPALTNQSVSSNQLRDNWSRYVRGWWGYFQLAQSRRPIYRLEGWIRRHIRKCFWIRWHDATGRKNALHRLGLRGRMLNVAQCSRGAWALAGNGSVQTALSTDVLRQYGFLMPSDCRAR
jgi:RNA-directed DNA polymerase